MHVEYLTSGLNIHSPQKKMDKNTCLFFCIVGYWSDDHCELNIELNLRAESLQLFVSWTLHRNGASELCKVQENTSICIHICIISKYVYPSAVYRFQYVGRNSLSHVTSLRCVYVCSESFRKSFQQLITRMQLTATSQPC